MKTQSLILCLLLTAIASTLPAMDRLEALQQRRQRLIQQLPAGPTLLVSAPGCRRNGDVSYPYRQESNFLYVTGYSHANAACLLLPGHEKPYQMFVSPASAQAAIWTGTLPGLEGAVTQYGANEAHAIGRMPKILKAVLANTDTLYFKKQGDALSKRIQRLIERHQKTHTLVVIDPTPVLHAARLIKDEYEVAMMQKAIDITCEAQCEAMRMARPGMAENEIQAAIEYVYKKQGALAHSFPSIVGAGPNTTVLHYEDGTRKVADGDLVLMDIGAEVKGYAADVTRTLPANGLFSNDQRSIYEIVLASADAAIAATKPGIGLIEIHNTSAQVVAKGLKQLGLITDENQKWQADIYMMYNSNHWLGLDVHDVGGRRNTLGDPMPLAPGMVFTVEPGIYVGAATLDLARQRAERAGADVAAFIEAITPAVERYMNIGVRIEDDILVTDDGHQNLSQAAPRTVSAVEAMMRQPPKHVIVQ